MIFSGIYFVIQPPKYVPRNVTRVSPKEAPKNIEKGFSFSADIANTVSWVLSPNSARNKVIKADKNNFQFTILPPGCPVFYTCICISIYYMSQNVKSKVGLT